MNRSLNHFGLQTETLGLTKYATRPKQCCLGSNCKTFTII